MLTFRWVTFTGHHPTHYLLKVSHPGSSLLELRLSHQAGYFAAFDGAVIVAIVVVLSSNHFNF